MDDARITSKNCQKSHCMLDGKPLRSLMLLMKMLKKVLKTETDKSS